MTRVRQVVRKRRWHIRAAAVTVGLAAMLAVYVSTAGGDAGNPILGTIRGTVVSTPKPGYPDAVTVYVRGQWNWFSHSGDCNFDRAATGVGIIWNDPNGPGTTTGANEVQRVSLTGTVTGGTFRLKFDGATTTAIDYNANAAELDAKLEALAPIGAGNVSVSKPVATQWDVEFTGALGKQNVAAIQVASKSLTGSGANVAVTTLTNGSPAVYNGWLLADGGISAYIGTKDATDLNPADRMVHPVDRGNVPEGYVAGTWMSTAQGYPANAAGDWPSGQQFADPSPPGVTASQVAAWKGGCGREPLSATASKGGHPDATGLSCGDGTTLCAGRAWGSWGYEKNGGLGYSHVYRSLADVESVCVNFYDVHGGGKFNSGKFQLVNGTKEITVDANGDNSIETNSFNVAEGANCFTFETEPTATTTEQKVVTNDTATVTWNDPTGTVRFDLYPPGNATCAGAPVASWTDALDGSHQAATDNPLSGPGSFVATTPGTWRWKLTYSGDPKNLPLTTACGLEQFTIANG